MRAKTIYYLGRKCASVVLLSILYTLSGWAADEVHPHRFFDGDALAHDLTPWILENTPEDVRLRWKFRPLTNARLYWGAAFNRQAYPPRQNLKAWMLEQPDNSISPDALYKQAIQMENGNVENGIILVWDVLRENWVEAKDRNQFDHIRKLIDITGERDLFQGNQAPIIIPSGPLKGNHDFVSTIRGDNFSAWYHFSGTTLRSFLTQNSPLSPVSGETYAGIMIFVEESYLHNEFVDAEKRNLIDRQGAIFGDRLARLLHRFPSKAEYAAAVAEVRGPYLYDDPSRFSVGYALLPGEEPVDYYYRNPCSLFFKAMSTALAPTLPLVPLAFGYEYLTNKALRDDFNKKFFGIEPPKPVPSPRQRKE